MTTNPESAPAAVDVPDAPANHGAGAEPATRPGGGETPFDDDPAADHEPVDSTDRGRPDSGAADDLPLEDATAYGIEGYDPDDPWNAVFWIESERAATVLPLTPTSLDHLVGTLTEVRDAQRLALGVLPEDDGDVGIDERPGAFRQVTRAARLATGSAPVARLWQTSVRGRMIIIGGAVVFVVLGIVASLWTR